MTKFDQPPVHPSHAGQRDTGRPHAVGAPALGKSEFVIPTVAKASPPAAPNSQANDRAFAHKSGEIIARPHGFTEQPDMADKLLAEAVGNHPVKK